MTANLGGLAAQTTRPTCTCCEVAKTVACRRMTAGCYGCLLRSASMSPQFRDASEEGFITRPYKALLELYFGAGCDLQKVHAEVRAASIAFHVERVPKC